MRKFGWLLPPAMLVLLTFFLLHIPAVVGGVQSGMATAALSVLPALFFFAVAADLTISLTGGALRPLSPKASVFLLGALCGFPVGAIVCERMCASGALDRRDAERLLPFVNNASPAFLLGAVGSLFGDRRIGVLLFLSQLAAASILCLPRRIKTQSDAVNAVPPPPADAFFDAVDRSVQSMLRVMALICLFSAILAVLRCYIPNNTVFAALALLLEIGNGAARSAELFGTSPCAAVTLCAFGCGFSGICVHMQVLSVIRSVKVRYNHFFFGKVMLSAMTAFFAFCGCKFVLGY